MITSQITAKPVFGSNPIGYTALTPNNNGETAFIAGSTLTGVFEFLESALTFVTDDIPATQANFLTLVKTYLDGTYMPSVFTDPAVAYDARYTITNIRLDFETVGTTSNRGIWVERVWKYFATINIQVNVD
jgi:hypothetical protein